MLNEVDDVVNEDHVHVGNSGPERNDADGVKAMKSPTPMSKAEWEEHCVKHHPFHEACPYCVCGRRPNSHHRRRRRKPRKISHLVADYGYLRAFDDDLAPLLGMLAYPWEVFFATLCPAKGPHIHTVKRVAQFMKDLGLTHFSYKSDR